MDHYLNCDDGTVLEGNFKVYISFKKGFMSKPVKLMELLHNTYFMEKYAELLCFLLLSALNLIRLILIFLCYSPQQHS